MALKLTDQIRKTVNKAEQRFVWKDFVSDIGTEHFLVQVFLSLISLIAAFILVPAGSL
jgi:hypothetical protein